MNLSVQIYFFTFAREFSCQIHERKKSIWYILVLSTLCWILSKWMGLFHTWNMDSAVLHHEWHEFLHVFFCLGTYLVQRVTRLPSRHNDTNAYRWRKTCSSLSTTCHVVLRAQCTQRTGTSTNLNCNFFSWTTNLILFSSQAIALKMLSEYQ